MKNLVFGRTIYAARAFAEIYLANASETIFVVSEYSLRGLSLRDANVYILPESEHNPLFGLLMASVNGPYGPVQAFYVRDVEGERHRRDNPEFYPSVVSSIAAII